MKIGGIFGFVIMVAGTIGLFLSLASDITTAFKKDDADPSRRPVAYARQVLVWIDPDTGCHYLTRDGYITPRLTADSKQLCVL